MTKASSSKQLNVEVNIRQMSMEDVEDILSIEKKIAGKDRALTYAPVPDSCIGGEIDSSFVAEVDGRVAGFVLGRIARSPTTLLDIAWIELIGVLPEYNRQGVGKMLVESWRERCRQRGIKKVHVMVNWRDWLMLSFFESLGFTRGELTNLVYEL
ncbi:MAG: GNAT family N-acetyltransferase [Dehalococcoidia bacterium]